MVSFLFLSFVSSTISQFSLLTNFIIFVLQLLVVNFEKVKLISFHLFVLFYNLFYFTNFYPFFFRGLSSKVSGGKFCCISFNMFASIYLTNQYFFFFRFQVMLSKVSFISNLHFLVNIFQTGKVLFISFVCFVPFIFTLR